MIVIDNYIKDKDLLDRLSDVDQWRLLDRDNYQNAGNSYYYNVGEPSNIWEEVINLVFEDEVLGLKDYDFERFEYWGNVLDERRQLDWHQDKTEELFPRVKKLCKVGVVLYCYPHKVWGGSLEIKNDYGLHEELDRVECVYNRLVLFDSGNKFHRVAPIFAGTRYGFQINLW
jgi:Rps23 Pro-64 3,4-dihydroxylase Tpa1-like proline 4-hydroxylase